MVYKKKIFFIIPNLSFGGQERVASRLSLELSKNYEIYFTLFDKKIAYPYNGYILDLNSPASGNIVSKAWNVIKRIYKLNELVKELKPKAVISFGESANLVNLLTPKNGIKTVISIRQDFSQNIEVGKFYKSFYLLNYKILYKKADIIITVSKQLEFELKNLLKSEKIKTIYNPIEVEEIKKKALEGLDLYEFIKEFPYLITVGRLTKQKGQWYLLRIFKELKEKYKDLKLLILGEGELKNYLVGLSETLGLKTYVWDRDNLNKTYNVYFLGFQKNPYKFIKHSKLFVFTSLWEGFPNVLIETLAVGKPIVSTDCRTGPREILAPKTDFLLEAKEPQMEEFGILMPNFERKILKINEPLTQQEKIWIDFLIWLLDNEKLLKDYERKAPIRAEDFHIAKIVRQWMEVIER